MLKKTITFTVLGAAACLLAISFAPAQTYRPRPPGVSEQAWIPLGVDAGFVVTERGSNAQDLADSPTVHGYLIAWRNGRWIRLDPENGARASPAL
jgi:hypothetical protein